MKLFLDRNKTLLPRIDVIYLLTRMMTLVGVGWYVFFDNSVLGDSNFAYVLTGTFAGHLVLFYLAIQGKFDIKLAYLSALVYDLILIPVLIIHTGGMQSSFFLLFYLTISVAAYILTFWLATATAIIVTLVFIGSVYQDLAWNNIFDISIRVAFVWVYFLALSYASEYLRRSEKRLLKLFDTLNRRTSELEKSQAQLELIYENTRSLAAILDTEGVIKEVMRIMSDLLQYSSSAIIQKDKRGALFYRARSLDGQMLVHPKAIDISSIELVARVFGLGEAITVKDISNREDYIPLNDQSRSLIVVPFASHGRISQALVAESGVVDAFSDRDLQVLSMVARSAGLALENAELHKKTEELTLVDELTGAFNYRYFVRKLQEEKRRALRYDLPLSLIMVDIDWFKKLNDSHGHEAGNQVLTRMSQIIRQAVRDVDIFCRYGGEEFIIILPQTPVSEASQIGERIRSQVEKEVFVVDEANKLKTTVSVGVSSFPENGKSQEDLVSVTDQAMYRAKGEGRNLVRVV